LGYDRGDSLYDTAVGQEVLRKWFQVSGGQCVCHHNLLYDLPSQDPRQVHVQHVLSKSFIEIELVLVKVENPLQKPGPVFNEIARVAYEHRADYLYRVNDDSEFLNPWVGEFVRTLQEMGPPYGVIGPYSGQNNIRILNHDFTHRLHMEIFQGDYYPPRLSDWWMDDWISMVYGNVRTRQAQSIEILHHINTHGRRYEVNMDHALLLQSLVEEGKARILQWMASHEVDNGTVHEFMSSRFDGYPFQDISKRE